MIHIIKQYKMLFTSLLFSGLNKTPNTGGESINSLKESKKDFRNALTDALKNGSIDKTEAKDLLSRLEGDKLKAFSYTKQNARDLLNNTEFKNVSTETFINKKRLIQKLEDISGNGIDEQKINSIIDNLPTEVDDIINPVNKAESENDTVVLKPMTIKATETPFEEVEGEVKTREKTVSPSTDKFMGFDAGITSKGEILKDVNIPSLEKIISNGNLGELVNDIKKALGTETISTFSFDNTLGFRNYSDVIPVLESAGYEIDKFLDIDEAIGVISSIEGAHLTQEKMNSGDLGYRENLKILLDYNIDGKLDNDIHFYTEELGLFNAIKSEGDFSNLLIGLGYKGKSDFDSQFSENYYQARKEFKTRLGTVLNSRLQINPTELIVSPDAVRDNIEMYGDIEREFESSPNFQKLIQKDRGLADLIKFQGAGIILGAAKGIGASFDIKELTYNFIDSLSIGFVEGTFGIVLDKAIFNESLKEYGVALHVGVANFIPYVAGSVELYKSDIADFQDMFPRKIDTGVKVSLGGSVFLTGAWGAGLDFSKQNEYTKEGIEGMKENMGEYLDYIFDSIEDGVPYSKLQGNDTKENEAVYTRLQGLYESFGKDGVPFLKEGALNNYEMELYKGAEGFQPVGFSVGVISAFGYLQPVIGIHGESHSTEYEQTQEAGAVYGGGGFEGIESNDSDLSMLVNNLDNTITERTRLNKYADTIIDPNNTLNTRWNGFKKFANRKGKYSPELSTTIDSFKSVLDSAEKNGVDDTEKLYIISSVVQLMKKSYDTKGGSIENYNTDYNSLLKMKEGRSKGYNKLFGFDISEESDMFDNRLREAGKKGTITETNLTGISFDASSTRINSGKINKTLKGVDVFFSNIQMLSDENGPILVKLENKSDIDEFIYTLQGLKNIDKDTQSNLINGIDNGTIELHYYSDPDGLDDRIIPMNITREGVSVFKPKFDTNRFGILFGIDVKDDKVEEVKDPEIETTPELEKPLIETDAIIIDSNGNEIITQDSGPSNFDPNSGISTPIDTNTYQSGSLGDVVPLDVKPNSSGSLEGF